MGGRIWSKAGLIGKLPTTNALINTDCLAASRRRKRKQDFTAESAKLAEGQREELIWARKCGQKDERNPANLVPVLLPIVPTRASVYRFQHPPAEPNESDSSTRQ
jgi:hypothetical protein